MVLSTGVDEVTPVFMRLIAVPSAWDPDTSDGRFWNVSITVFLTKVWPLLVRRNRQHGSTESQGFLRHHHRR